MEKLFIVVWANANQDDRGNSKAYGNVHGVYRTLEEARAGLTKCKDEFVDEITNNPDFDEQDREYATRNLSIYGSEAEGYFELDNDVCDIIEETYIQIVETELN